MSTNTRYEHLKVLSERVASILFYVDISHGKHADFRPYLEALLLVTHINFFCPRTKDDNKNYIN